MKRLSYEEFNDLFASFKREALHLEMRDAYGTAAELPHLRRWLAGEPDDTDWLQPWFDTVRAGTRAGKRFRRARIVSEPLSEYQRWVLKDTHRYVDAGKDIRWVPRRLVSTVALPGNDFWLFDDEVAVVARLSTTSPLPANKIKTRTRQRFSSAGRPSTRYGSWQSPTMSTGPPSPAKQARDALGVRLREIRKDAGLTERRLSMADTSVRSWWMALDEEVVVTESGWVATVRNDYDKGVVMRLTFLGKDSVPDQSPTLYATDRGSYVVQGWIVTDLQILAAITLADDEAIVEVPAKLMRHLAKDGLVGDVVNMAPPIVYVMPNGNYIVKGKQMTDQSALGQMSIPDHESCVEVSRTAVAALVGS